MPAQIYDLRQMPDDIKKGFRDRGIDPDDTIIVDDAANNKTEFRSVKELGDSTLKTIAINAGKTILPTLVGAGTGAATMAGAAALGFPMAGPGSLVPATVAGVGGAVAGGYGASKLQESVLDKFAPDMQTEAELLRRANPRAATIGQIAGGFAGGLNSIGGLISRAGGIKEAAKLAAVPTALGGTLEAYSQYNEEGKIDPLRVGMAAAAGPFQAVNTKAGQAAEDIGAGLVGKLVGKAKDFTPPAPRTRDAIAKDILDAHAAGQFAEGSPVYNALAVELNQPGAPADALIKLAQKHAEQNIQTNPEERAKIADLLWDSIKVKQLPAEQLPQSKLETKLAEFIADGTVNSREELVSLARQSNLDIAANNLKREKAKAAGPVRDQYTRMDDQQVEVLVNASPDVLPPNASILDNAIFEGKKKGYVKTAEDIRQLEGAYQVNPDSLPSMARQMWQERQTPPAAKKAEEVAAAFEKRDINYFSREFPKLVGETLRAKKQVDDVSALLDDLNTPEDEKAKLRGQVEEAQREMNDAWINLLKRSFEKYFKIEPPERIPMPPPFDPPLVPKQQLGTGFPLEGFVPGKLPPNDTDINNPTFKSLLAEMTADPNMLPAEIRNQFGPGDAIQGYIGDNPEVRYSSLDPNQNIRKAVEWFAPGLKPLEVPREENFNKWFTGSKVVDENGEPLAVYHGTNAEFNQFKQAKDGTFGRGIYFTPKPEVASSYASQSAEGISRKTDQQVLKVFANIKNPIELASGPYAPIELLQKLGYSKDKASAIHEKALENNGGLSNEAQAKLKAQGYDGIVTRNVDGSIHEIVAFSPNQIKSATGNRGTFDWGSPDIRYSLGASPKTVGRFLDATLGRLNDLIYEGTIGSRRLWKGTKSTIDRILDLGPSGKIVADTDFKMRRDSTKVFNTAAGAYVEAFDSLNKTETRRVNQYLNDTFDTKGHSFIIPTAKEQAAIDKIRNEGLLYLVDNGIIRGGPGVREGGMYRDQRIDPYYLPTIVDGKVRKIVKNREKGYEQLAADWEAWYTSRLGISADESKNLLQQYLTATGPNSANDAAKFGALTQAEGVGLPPSWRADPRKALLYHAYRAAKNFAWFTHVQRNPAMAKAVGETDDGWGGVIDTAAATNDSIAGTPAVEAWKTETNNHLSAGPDWTEDITRIASAFQLGPLTAIRDVISTPAHMAELIPGGEFDKVLQALKNVVTTDVRGKMEAAGDVRAKTLQPFEFNANTFSEGVLDKVLEVTRTLNGRNLLESTARQWAYETGRLVGASRLAKGDLTFFEKLNIPDWRSMQPEDLFNSVGKMFVDSAQGGYNARGLPDWLLNVQANKANKFLFSLQRWGVERFNNWHKNAWMPAVNEGEFRPLFKSILGGLVTSAGLNALQEYFFNQKPPEMKWSEFMRAENKELPYTLFSKLQNVGFAGVYSSLGMAAAKLHSGESIEPINNLGWDLLIKSAQRTGQAWDALRNRGADGFDVFKDLLDTMAQDNIQAWRLYQNAQRPDIGNREEKIFKRQTGEPNRLSATAASQLSNPFDPVKDFRRSTTVEEMQKALPEVGRAFERNPNLDVRIQSPIRRQEAGEPSYYDFVSQLQGEAAGQAALQRDQQLDQLSLLKRQELARAQIRARIAAGPR